MDVVGAAVGGAWEFLVTGLLVGVVKDLGRAFDVGLWFTT